MNMSDGPDCGGGATTGAFLRRLGSLAFGALPAGLVPGMTKPGGGTKPRRQRDRLLPLRDQEADQAEHDDHTDRDAPTSRIQPTAPRPPLATGTTHAVAVQ